MPTKQTSTGSNSTAFQFDPSSLSTYHANISQLMPWLRQNVTNPFGSDAFQKESAASQDNANQIGQRMKSNVLNNAAALGYGTNGALFNTMLQNAGRATSGLQAQGFRSAVGNAIQRQMGSAGMLSAFQPLMTGSNGNFNSTQTTGGLGTWLPQLAGSALGAVMGGFTGGAGAGAGATGSVIPKFSSVPVPDPGFGNLGPNAFGSMPNIGFGLGGPPMLAPQTGGSYSY